MARLRALLAFAVFVVALLPRQAEAYPWMIRHGYTNCAQCHVDPSGGGVLTEYGRGQGEILVRTHYEEMTESPGKKAEFLFGLLPLPDPLLLQADVRSLFKMTALDSSGMFGAKGKVVKLDMDFLARETWVRSKKGWLVKKSDTLPGGKFLVDGQPMGPPTRKSSAAVQNATRRRAFGTPAIGLPSILNCAFGFEV